MNLLVDEGLCRLLHDLQGHTVYTPSDATPEPTKAKPTSPGNWEHSYCCGGLKPYFLVYLQEAYNANGGTTSAVFWTKNIKDFTPLLLNGYDDADHIYAQYVGMSKSALNKKGIYPLYEKSVNAPHAVDIYAGGFGQYRDFDGKSKKVGRNHMRYYNTPIRISMKNYNIIVWVSVLPTLPYWENPDELEEDEIGGPLDMFSWIDYTADDYVSNFADWKVSPFQKTHNYGGVPLVALDFKNLQSYHNDLECDICTTLTPMFQESEDGAVRLLKGVGMEAFVPQSPVPMKKPGPMKKLNTQDLLNAVIYGTPSFNATVTASHTSPQFDDTLYGADENPN